MASQVYGYLECFCKKHLYPAVPDYPQSLANTGTLLVRGVLRTYTMRPCGKKATSLLLVAESQWLLRSQSFSGLSQSRSSAKRRRS